jgi:hypothetical protein
MKVAATLSVLLVLTWAASAAPQQAFDSRATTIAGKNAAVRTVQRDATECVYKSMRTPAVSTHASSPNTAFGDRIVEAVHMCTTEMRSMISAYDRQFGEGEGERFFMGPYLDLLPTMIEERLRNTAGP